ncbi:helix-turn-helix transcriptional regulator [Jongsikchunia kroppenstedtii]|uniref:helix-turn-helix transcriptional regulator n=1 Tax=Jongsikchunia kroppenstedtii TaxID=1121721 RepID=UPI00035C0EC9|nr:YafY family protein [Jongsikchunia kroppenstedtii]
MARPTARVLTLLELLQAGGTQSVATLSTRLGVDERTVRRYVTQLVEMGVPVESIRGRHGGYRVAPGYRMPPLMLTDEEALTLLLGLAVGRRSGGLPIDDETVEDAISKLRRVLPQGTAARLDALLFSADLSLLGPSDRSAQATGDTDPNVLMIVAEAARDRHPVEIGYTRHGGQASQRTILPYGIVARSGRWYVTGHESRTGEVRTFRVDRISNPVALPGSFNLPAGFDVRAAVLASLAATPWRYQVSVRVAGTVNELRLQVPAGLATLEPASSDNTEPWTRVRLRAERLDWVAPYFAGLGRDLVIEEPSELREQTRVLAERLLAACEDTASQPAT